MEDIQLTVFRAISSHEWCMSINYINIIIIHIIDICESQSRTSLYHSSAHISHRSAVFKLKKKQKKMVS